MTKKIVRSGLVASIAMAMIEMVYEGMFGVGFWSAPVFISATLLRSYQEVALPVTFVLLPATIGMVGHMMNSVVLDTLFTSVFGNRIPTSRVGMLYGSMYGIAVFIVMWFGVLPVIDPIMLHLNPSVFALSHIIWGAMIGLAITNNETV